MDSIYIEQEDFSFETISKFRDKRVYFTGTVEGFSRLFKKIINDFKEKAKNDHLQKGEITKIIIEIFNIKQAFPEQIILQPMDQERTLLLAKRYPDKWVQI